MPPQLSLWHKLRRALTFFRRRLWWFDVLYPVALGVLLFSVLSYAVYAGQRQWRLSLQAEKKLLDFSLAQASRGAAKQQSQLLVLAPDAATIAANPSASPQDAAVGAYAEAIDRLASAGVPLLFVRWDLRRHVGDDSGYFALARVLRQHRETTKVYFVLQLDQSDRLPLSIEQGAEWLEDVPCGEANELQTTCSFMPDYHPWVVQRILETFGRDGAAKQAPRWVSEQLPNAFPSYILRLQPLSTTMRLGFADLFRLPAGTSLQGVRAAFIGTGVGPVALTSTGRTDVVATIYDRIGARGPLTGTPLHEFWAMLAQMFAGGDEARVPSSGTVASLTVVFCLFLVAIMLAFDVFVGLAAFLAFGVLAPLANAVTLRWAQLYMPLFDCYYFGLSVLCVAGLVQLSLLSLQRWRLDARRRLHARAADLKGNFISLLTHNLNTPVAKMQGMLTLLTKQAGNDPWLPQALQAEALVTQLEYSIRSVLIAAALEEGVVHPAARHARALAEELAASSVASLRRLGIGLTCLPVSSGDEGQEYLPLNFDVRALSAAITGVVALFHQTEAEALVRVSVGLHVETDLASGADQTELLRATVHCAEHWISAEAAAILTAPTPLLVRTIGEGLFFPSVLAGLAQLTTATFRGHIELSPKAAGGSIILTFRPLAPGQVLTSPSQPS